MCRVSTRESNRIVKSVTGRLLIAISALFIVVHAHADEWADGNVAFERGNYAAALGPSRRRASEKTAAVSPG